MEQAGIAPTPKQKAEHAMYEKLVYSTIRSAFGPRIKYLACGGAPLDRKLATFFNGIGLTMIQGYGLTETAAPFAFTRVHDNVIGLHPCARQRDRHRGAARARLLGAHLSHRRTRGEGPERVPWLP